MTLYSIPPLISSLAFLGLGLLVLIKGKENKRTCFAFFINCCTTFWWQFSWFILFNTTNPKIAAILVKVGYVGITFIPTTFFHFYASFINHPKYKKRVQIYYIIGFVFLGILLTTNLYIDGFYKYFFGFYPRAGVLHPLFLLYLNMILFHNVLCLFKKGMSLKWKGVLSSQIKFLIIAFLIYCCSASDFFVNYGFSFYPLGVVFILFSLILSGYTIIRYRLMDIKIALTRFSIFVFVYTLVLGIPFGLGFYAMGKGLWLFPVTFMAILATAGPYLYLYIQKRAEKNFLIEQKQYQETLYKASEGMGQIKDLDRLLKLIIHILIKAVRLKGCKIYVLNGQLNAFVLKETRGNCKKNILQIREEEMFIKFIKEKEVSILFEEMEQRVLDSKEEPLKKIFGFSKEIGFSLAVPCFAHGELIAILCLDNKVSETSFSKDDLIVFSMLANHVGLAIENALYYEEAGKDLAQRFQEARLKSIGEMGSGVAHQLNNRFNYTTITAGMILEMIEENDIEKCSLDELINIIKFCQKNIKKIENDAIKGGEIATAITSYSRSSMRLAAYSLNKTISSSITLCLIKHPNFPVDIIKNVDTGFMYWGNMATVQDIIFNALDNSFDAMKSKMAIIRNSSINTVDYEPNITINAFVEFEKLKIEIIDNGIGIKSDDLKNSVFIPFFTTKSGAGSKNRGTGMGLAMMKQLIEKNNGSICIDSEFNEWTKIILLIPKATDEQIKNSKKDSGDND